MKFRAIWVLSTISFIIFSILNIVLLKYTSLFLMFIYVLHFLAQKTKRVEYSITVNDYEDEPLTYLVLKSTYYFGFNLVGEELGENSGVIPFESLELAEQFKIELCGK